jgi:hypothetical protein
MQRTDAPRVVVIGGGAAGLLAAGTACRNGAAVTVIEQNDRPGKKILISGKGRCNVTNDCTPSEFIPNVTKNGKFLFSAINRFSPQDMKELLESLGVELKTERGRRVFPTSDKSSDILSALTRYASGCSFVRAKAKAIALELDRAVGVVTDQGTFECDSVILATGGASYPLTGSDGSGYRIARASGHTVTPLIPSLVPLTSPSPLCAEMQGLSLKNVALTLYDGERALYRDFGEMLFTHFGLSGPMILSASAHLRNTDFGNVRVEIDLKPALDEQTLEKRILSDFAKYVNRDAQNGLNDLLPQKMILPFLALADVDPRKKINVLTRAERERMLSTLKRFTLPVSGFRPIEEAIVTSGGVSVKEIDPKTMSSRLVKGLYFAGEIMDVDAYTGGYNLQIAFSTGFLAGESAAGFRANDK